MDRNDDIELHDRQVMAAARMRTYRSRRKDGIEVLPVPANVVDLAEALIAGGFLPRTKAGDREALVEATARFLEAVTTADVATNK